MEKTKKSSTFGRSKKIMANIKRLVIYFENEISFSEIPLFRGAINSLLEADRSVLFHNHIGRGFRFSYPLIQYKRIKGKAVIVCINEGTEAIGEFFNAKPRMVNMGRGKEELVINNIIADQYLVQVWETTFNYRIHNWLALNSQNYKTYQSLNILSERITFLEKILIGNILSFFKGIGVNAERNIECHLISLEENRLVNYKGIKFMSFDAAFQCNVSLPNLIGIGKDASMGSGVISEIRIKEE